MINNYSKDGLIMPIKGKKYTKEQILQMLTVYSLKSTLSIGEIKRLLWGVYATEGFCESDLVRLYDGYQQAKQNGRDDAIDLLDGIFEENDLDVSDDKDYALAVCTLVALSAHLKNIAQVMIEARFPEPVTDDEQKEEKEKQKEKEKKEKKEKKEEKKEKKSKKKKKDEE
jgi:hypothetical protein